MASTKKKGKKPEKSSKTVYQENKYINYAVLFLFAVFLCYFSTFKITGDDDVFWHLATGKYIVNTGHVPDTDVFGYMTEGQQWMPFEWGWDVITYGVYSLAGYAGISILRTVLLLLFFGILYYILQRFKVGFALSVFLLLILSFSIIDRLTPRPHLMSYLFFALLLLIITNYRYFNRKNHKILYFIPLIFLLWANMHMGIIAGGFLMVIYFASELIQYLKPSAYSGSKIPALGKPEITRLFIILAASALVMLINPNFLQTYIYAYDHTKMKMLETVNEWKSPFSSTSGDGFVLLLYKGQLFIGLLILYYSLKKKDIFPALLYIGFALYSVRAMRFTVDYVIITFVFIAVALDFILNSVKSEELKNIINKKPGLKILSGLLIIFLIYSLAGDKLYLEYLKYYRVTGFGINKDFIPVQMFDFMKQNQIPETGERIFNHFGTGGFFVWNFPDRKNFIDSRNLNDDIFNKYNNIIAKRPGFEQKLEEYNIDYALYLAPDLVRDPSEMEKTVISFFCKSPDWKLIFWDDKSFLWVKNIPKFQTLISKYEYKYLSPYNFMYQRTIIDKGINEDKEKLRNEINRRISEDPESLVLNSVLKQYGKRINNK